MHERSFGLDHTMQYAGSDPEKAETPNVGDFLTENQGMTDLENAYSLTRQLAGEVGIAIGEMLRDQDCELEHALVVQNIIDEAAKIKRGEFDATNKENFYDEEETALSALKQFNRNLISFLAKPRSLDGYRQGQLFIARFLSDKYYDNPAHQKSFDSRPITPSDLSEGQSEIMKRINLRDYENSTSNTLLTLTALFHEIEGAKPDQLQTILEIGCGQGRIAIPLASLGHKINALDISEEALEALKIRAQNVSEKLTGASSGTDDPDPLAGQITEVKEKIHATTDHDDYYGEKIPENIITAEGDFFELDKKDYEQKFGAEKADSVVIMWHTFGFAGNREGQLKLLKNVYDNLKPGGRLIIEMPDRNFGPYARAIREFYAQELQKKQEDPDYKIWPYGTLVDSPSQSDNPSDSQGSFLAPRYFPSNLEMMQVLADSGFRLLHMNDYFVANEDNNSLKIKENLWVAKKPSIESNKSETV